MEIIIKAKQKFNPYFSFLNHGDGLNPYYRHVLKVISSGAYVPGSEEAGDKPEGERGKPESSPNDASRGVEAGDVGGISKVGGEENGGGGKETTTSEDGKQRVAEEKEGSGEDSREEEEDSDDDGYELHPLLRVSTTPRSSKPSTPTPPPSSVGSSTTEATVTAEDARTSNLVTSAFYSKRLGVNAAPSLDREGHSQAVNTSTSNGYQRSHHPNHQQSYGRYVSSAIAVVVPTLVLLHLSM